MVTTCRGIHFPLACNARLTAFSIPPQQGTSIRTTKEKLMAYLLLQAKNAGSNHFTIPFDRREPADYLEVDRSGLSAEIGKLQRAGVLRSEKRHFTLLRP